ncbi:reverse transcriptase domain-containing protein [Gracilimonas amylolytica]|uniref:reverse transcriptase domain-containing protein n=1 Tax=Gracilimonas amylolytica TaxID=1749045 RepID=UPI000CD94F47|nr:reverse transcriptase domain-containing protein [Gracilimonas amylolytica]
MPHLFEIDEIQEAYLKLKQHMYYDSSNTNLPLRKSISEFENLGKEKKEKLYVEIQKAFLTKKQMDSFLNKYLSEIGYNLIPKSIKPENGTDDSVITNNRKFKSKNIADRYNLIIDAPISIHLISVLWIMQKGPDFDNKLSDTCYGNRLILKENESGVVSGRGCFKPYIKQYQSWRDDGVEKAKANLDAGIDVAFVNLDITEYYYHIKLNWNDLPKSDFKALNKINYPLKRIHQYYSNLLFDDFEGEFQFSSRKKEKETDIKETILPIGLMSSYVLANYYLLKWDKLVKNELKPLYYGRYVDDILMVISNPNSDYKEIESLLKDKIKGFNSEVSEVPDSVKFVVKNLPTVLNIEQFQSGEKSRETDYRIRLKELDELFLQPNKMMLYEFKADQSLSVIEKLKKDLEEKSSEFRFLATDMDGSFDSKAFELLYDNSFGKPKTLKDYKENRYGISAFLAKRINASLRVEREHVVHESEKILAFFQGVNAIRFYQQWERIFTYLIVNQRKMELLKFYKIVLKEIDQVRIRKDDENYDDDLSQNIKRSLFKYLNISLSLALSLDPGFFKGYLQKQFNFIENNPEYRIGQYNE